MLIIQITVDQGNIPVLTNINGNLIRQEELVKEEVQNLYKFFDMIKLLRIQSYNMEEIPELVNILDGIVEFNSVIPSEATALADSAKTAG